MTFNDNARLDPSRVRRRGAGGTSRPGKTIAVGGGLGGVLIVLLVVLLNALGGGADLNSLGGLGPNPQDDTIEQDFQTRCSTGASANTYADCRVTGAINSLDAYWATALPTAGIDLRYPGITIFDQATSTACGPASSATGPFYCPPDETIYVDTTFFDDLHTRFGASSGPLAEMYVVAHEYGHHIENQLGVFDVADRSGTGPDSDSVLVELMADCLAGMWAGDASTTLDASGTPFLQPFTAQDVADALSAAAAVGDDRIQQATQGEVTPHTFTHGTAAQRQAAFTAGYESGTLTACDPFGVVKGG